MKRNGLILLVVFGVVSVASSAHGSLQTQWESCSLIASYDLADLGTASATGMEPSVGSSSSSNGDGEDRPSDARFWQRLRLPGLAEHSTTSSSAAPTPTDGGVAPPVMLEHALLLPSEMDVGPVIAYQGLIPPDPPPMGLLKIPRARI